MNSYLKFLSRHRLFTFINIVGLCLSMAFLLLLGDLIYRQTTVENYKTRADRTFVLGNEMCMMSNFRVGERLKDRFPEVEDWCSICQSADSCFPKLACRHRESCQQYKKRVSVTLYYQNKNNI